MFTKFSSDNIRTKCTIVWYTVVIRLCNVSWHTIQYTGFGNFELLLGRYKIYTLKEYGSLRNELNCLFHKSKNVGKSIIEKGLVKISDQWWNCYLFYLISFLKSHNVPRGTTSSMFALFFRQTFLFPIVLNMRPLFLHVTLGWGKIGGCLVDPNLLINGKSV